MSIKIEKENVSLHEVTRELMHEYYKEFTTDPDIFMDMSRYYVYEYDQKKIDAKFDSKNEKEDRKEFMIMVDNTAVGEICLKHIDYEKRECELSIHMKNDKVKNKGYGTKAERIMIKYAFEEFNMKTILADAVLKNKRSQHVLEKVGFQFTRQDETFKYYRYERGEYNKRNCQCS